MYRIAHALHFRNGHGQAQQQSPVKILIDRFPQAHHIGVVGKLPAGLDIVGQIQYFFQQRHVGPAGGVVQNGLRHLVVHAVHMAGDGCAGLGVQQLQGVMLVSVSAVDIAETLAEMEQRGVMLIGSIVVLSVFLAWLLSTILVKPLARVTKAIEDLTDGMLDEEISVPDYTETELITDAFNKMVNRMKILDESRQEFVSNVSHELKTPLTSMKVLADSLVGQQGVPEELYQEFMSDITAEIDRENKIITDLLSLVKMDKKAADVNITHMDINQLLEDILKRLRPIADRRNIDLILDCFRPVDADVDEVKFTLAVSNLVENGIKYNVDDGWVRVSLDADHKYFYITVADSGMGIPEDSIERIFERFYRVDKSHSKEIGGTGLGLAITKSSIAMHHGTIKVFSKEGEGTTFSVRIPLSYIPS